MIVLEELAPLGGLGISLSMHSDIVAPYLLSFGSDAVKRDCLPRMATGEMIGALAISEPGAGSDVKAVRTTAVKVDGGYLVNGSKIFISNGFECGVAVVVAKTDPGADAKGISLFAVESSMPGFEKGRKLKKIGLKAQDTAELFFKDVFVPTSHLLGEENKGFGYLMHELPWERLQIAIAAVASGEAALNLTIDYARERRAFRKPVLDFQNTRFKLAELKSEIQIAQVFVDRCMELALKNELDPTTAAMAKYWCTDLQCKVVDECMQFHGGYGFMQEYAIARAWVDARAQKIYGGTNEIMKRHHFPRFVRTTMHPSEHAKTTSGQARLHHVAVGVRGDVRGTGRRHDAGRPVPSRAWNRVRGTHRDIHGEQPALPRDRVGCAARRNHRHADQQSQPSRGDTLYSRQQRLQGLAHLGEDACRRRAAPRGGAHRRALHDGRRRGAGV